MRAVGCERALAAVGHIRRSRAHARSGRTVALKQGCFVLLRSAPAVMLAQSGVSAGRRSFFERQPP